MGKKDDRIAELEAEVERLDAEVRRMTDGIRALLPAPVVGLGGGGGGIYTTTTTGGGGFGGWRITNIAPFLPDDDDGTAGVPAVA